MKPFVSQSFWSEPDIESQSPEVKLAVLWLNTNPHTTSLGFCEVTSRRFAFETGLPEEALQRAVEALPDRFARVGKAIFIRNYIREQAGTGQKLVRNNFFRTLTALFYALTPELQAVVSKEYEEFASLSKNPLQSPDQGLAKGKDREGKDRIEGGLGERVDFVYRILRLYNRTPGSCGTDEGTVDAAMPADTTAAHIRAIERYVTAERAKGDKGRHRRDLYGFCKSFHVERDRATAAFPPPKESPPPRTEPEALPDAEDWHAYIVEFQEFAEVSYSDLTPEQKEAFKDWAGKRSAATIRRHKGANRQQHNL